MSVNEEIALGLLRKARAVMIAVRDDDKRPSRELSVALTECDAAILWLQFDMQTKTPPVNQAAVKLCIHKPLMDVSNDRAHCALCGEIL